jgi:hypothetical protein
MARLSPKIAGLYLRRMMWAYARELRKRGVKLGTVFTGAKAIASF